MIDVRIGDSRKLIHGLADKSIDCVVTSPPYWGLRDYKTDPLIFDGQPDCEHEWGDAIVQKQRGAVNGVTAKVGNQINGVCGTHIQQGSFCQNCGAWRGQLGLEPTPELFIMHLLDFFDDVKMKLKDEGNVFINLGDTYNGSGNGNNFIDPKNKDRDLTGQKPDPTRYDGIPKKCLCMVPQRFAWGMIERGWILRNEIIWAKPNHMPESVTDRLTKSHEVIYHFVKQGKYYYDLDAIREPLSSSSIERITQKTVFEQAGGLKQDSLRGVPENGNASRCNKMVQALAKKYQGADYQGKWKENEGYMNEIQRRINDARAKGKPHDEALNHPNGKNPGDVWHIPTAPYPESHFAVFPLELVRRPILAGCPVGGTVLDPFAGSGTVGEFCRHNDRNAILFELNPDYKKLIEDRAMLKIPELSRWLKSPEG